MNERERRKQRQANQRAGLIASYLHNRWFKKKHEPGIRPMDFWEERGEPERMTPEEAREHFTAWAEARNQTVH